MHDITSQKQKIKTCFNKAAANYEQAAVMQKEALNHLLSKLIMMDYKPKIVLDLGAGSGYGTRLLVEHFPQTTVIGLDLAERMTNVANSTNPSANYLCADFDFLPFHDHTIDLIFSNMALQWSLNFTTTLIEWKNKLTSNGLIALSTLVNNSLYELRECWAHIDGSERVNYFMTEDKVKQKLSAVGFNILYDEITTMQIFHQDFTMLLHSLKDIGANHVMQQEKSARLTKQSLFAAEQYYQHYAIAGKLPITYAVCYIIAEVRK